MLKYGVCSAVIDEKSRRKCMWEWARDWDWKWTFFPLSSKLDFLCCLPVVVDTTRDESDWNYSTVSRALNDLNLKGPLFLIDTSCFTSASSIILLKKNTRIFKLRQEVQRVLSSCSYYGINKSSPILYELEHIMTTMLLMVIKLAENKEREREEK